jgi:hypothetical protein
MFKQSSFNNGKEKRPLPDTNGCISPSSKGNLDCDVSHIAIISLHRLVLLGDDSEDVTHLSLWHLNDILLFSIANRIIITIEDA